MDLTDPEQWNAYAYSNDTPITMSDPTGLTGSASCQPGEVGGPGACTGTENGSGDPSGNNGSNNKKKNSGGGNGGNNGAGTGGGSCFGGVCNHGWQGNAFNEWWHNYVEYPIQRSLDSSQRFVKETVPGAVGSGWRNLIKWQSDRVGDIAAAYVVSTGRTCSMKFGMRACQTDPRRPLSARGGTTFGNAFVQKRSLAELDRPLMEHEKWHRDEQWEKYGAMFGPAYLRAEYEAWKTGATCNRFEIEAEVNTWQGDGQWPGHGGGGSYTCW
jgi:hypothetical protein